MADQQPEDWRHIAERAQKRVLHSIPERWLLSDNVKAGFDGNAVEFIPGTGILTERQLAITGHNASELLVEIHSGSLKAVEVCEAFCARSAIAHQLVNCLTDFFPNEALAYAKSLDEAFAATGKPIGPLHGMPMAVKDMSVEGCIASSCQKLMIDIACM